MIDRRHLLALLTAPALLPARALAGGASAPVESRDSLARHFTDDGTAGTFVALTGDGRIIVTGEHRARDAILPASTFKIPNSIIALETGVVADPDKDVFKWDGVKRAFPDWNRNHTLRSAIAASAVPVYQEIARRIGAVRMEEYVDVLGYGNRDIGGGIDRFWLTGDLRISPLQQIAFLDRLRRGVLPVSERSQRLTRSILPQTKVGSALIRAKTGLVGVDDTAAPGGWKATVGWIVGWAGAGANQTVFALNLDIRDSKHIAGRMKLAQQCLADIGAI